MTFYGQEPTGPAGKTLRTFTYKTWGGREKTVEANYVQFMNEHVTFWLETGEAWDVLVLAEQNKDVTGLREAK